PRVGAALALHLVRLKQNCLAAPHAPHILPNSDCPTTDAAGPAVLRERCFLPSLPGLTATNCLPPRPACTPRSPMTLRTLPIVTASLLVLAAPAWADNW